MSAGTIFALATAPGRAGIAVIRVSGPACAALCGVLSGRPPPLPRRTALRELCDPASGERLDQALVVWHPGPASYTGEDVLELQVHGGPAVIQGVLAALAARPELRLAEPGEFTRRAFRNGRMDLTAAEGLADLIAAETAAQRRQALRQLEGELGRLYEGWRERLLAALARIEAEIDFAAEEDVPDDLLAQVRPDILRLRDEVRGHLSDDGRGERLRSGVVVAIIGAPNAGKSSLLNLLVRRDVAIVSPEAGTTRDVLEVPLDLAGYPVTLLDTAGLREAAGAVEAEGVRRARARAAAADLRLLLLDGERWPPALPEAMDAPGTLDERVVPEGLAALDASDISDENLLLVANKTDLGRVPAAARLVGRPVLGLSCRTGAGVEALLAALGRAVAARLPAASAPLLTRTRHRDALGAVAAALDRFVEGAAGAELALLAEDLRLATRALGRITGRVEVEQLLDRIFAEFCIGK